MTSQFAKLLLRHLRTFTKLVMRESSFCWWGGRCRYHHSDNFDLRHCS